MHPQATYRHWGARLIRDLRLPSAALFALCLDRCLKCYRVWNGSTTISGVAPLSPTSFCLSVIKISDVCLYNVQTSGSSRLVGVAHCLRLSGRERERDSSIAPAYYSSSGLVDPLRAAIDMIGIRFSL